MIHLLVCNIPQIEVQERQEISFYHCILDVTEAYLQGADNMMQGVLAKLSKEPVLIIMMIIHLQEV